MMMESFFREGHLWGLAFVLLGDFGWRRMVRNYQEPEPWKVANRWASVAFLLVLAPLVWLDLYAINILSQRLMMVLLIAPSLVSVTVYTITYQREIARIPVPAPPPAELSLESERLPLAGWSVVLPPILVALAVWWLRTHDGAIVWDGVLPYPAQFMSMTLIIVNLSGILFPAFAFAYWYGAPRTFTGRRPALLASVLTQWTMCNGSLLMVALSFPNPWYVYLPLVVATAIPIVAGIASGVWSSAVYKRHPWPRTAFYYDASDAAIHNYRGLNMANPWSWVLSAVFLGTLATQCWLMYWSWGPH